MNTTLNTLLLYDRDYKQPTKIYLPFAENNVLLKNLDQLKYPIINFWTMDKTVILGMADQRLNSLSSGLTFLKDNNYKYFVRNSGGLAVVNDSGVLNVSIFLPRDKDNDLSINDGYQLMVNLVQNTFPSITIDVKEIADSYCPGDFDLSINNQKFAGISQRRVSNGIVIMAYFSVNGNQIQRSELLKNFYEKGDHINSSFDYPEINISSMANLDTLINQPLSINEFKQMLLTTLSQKYKFDYESVNLYTQTTDYQAKLKKALVDLQQRNEQIL